MSRVLISGGTGFTGSNLVMALSEPLVRIKAEAETERGMVQEDFRKQLTKVQACGTW
jgi:nucleoside-diphosphate-sugar epimerase